MSKSRPKRNQVPPPPPPATTTSSNGWCASCGRLLPVETKISTTPRKYCSSTCRSHSRSTSLTQSRLILAQTFHELLLKATNSNAVILCSEAESVAFARSASTSSASTATAEAKAKATTNASGTETSNQREEARRAARRLVNFGFESQGVQETRAVDAVQNGMVVEGSFAKGEWGIRWR